MRKYKQIDIEERIEIEVSLKQGKSHQEIAKILKRSQPTISREISRNTEGKEIYLAYRANERAMWKQYWQRYKAPLKGWEVREYVIKRLKEDWSPEAISGRIEKDMPGEKITPEAIYQYIYHKDNNHLGLWKHLKLHRKKRMQKDGRKVRKSKLKNTISIEERSKKIEQREEEGHWETDNMEGKRSDKTTISVTVERVSRYMITGVMADGGSKSKTEHIIKRLPKKRVRTITADNGGENAGHEKISKKLDAKIYFCHPYSSWEKGSVENAIGRLRRWIPKGKSIQDLSPQKLGYYTKKYNTVPRKCLNWLTPEEVFLHNLVPQSDALPT